MQRRSRIRYRVLLTMILLALLSLFIQSQITHRQALAVIQDQSRDAVRSTLTIAAQQISDSVFENNRIFQSAYLNPRFRDYLKTLAHDPATLSDTQTVTALQSVFLSLIGSRTNIFSIIYVDPQNNVTYCSRDEAGHLTGTSNLPPQYQALLSDSQWESDLMLLPTARHMLMKHHAADNLPYVFAVARKIVNTESQFRPAGTMFITIDPSYLYPLFDALKISADTRIYLLNSDSQIIYDSDNAMLGEAFAYEIADGSDPSVTIDNQSFIPMRQAIEGSNWSLLYLVPSEYSNDAASSISQTITLIVLALFCFVIVAAILLSYAISRPLENLSVAMRSIDINSLSTRVPCRGTDEIAQLSASFNTLLDKLEDSIAQEYKLKLENKSAQLRLLQAQLNPHFLSNVLQSISSIALIRGVDEINVMAKSLGKMMHTSIKSKGTYATLKEEITHVESYLAIQSIRFGNRLRTTLDIPASLLDVRVPRIILQPMVDNAITHGLEQSPDTGVLYLQCSQEGDNLRIEVTDNGQGIEPDALSDLIERIRSNTQTTDGIGLPNLYARLRLLYGDRFTFHMESEKHDGTTVVLTIPLERSSPDDSNPDR
ncbi:MAG: sensor histidine kinase [Bacillota bacterium]